MWSRIICDTLRIQVRKPGKCPVPRVTLPEKYRLRQRKKVDLSVSNNADGTFSFDAVEFDSSDADQGDVITFYIAEVVPENAVAAAGAVAAGAGAAIKRRRK